MPADFVGLEIERTFAPGEDDDLARVVQAVVPDLGEGWTSDDPSTADLEATYFDTDDLRLTRAGITLRRRSGGADEGWHLKLPVGAGRDEIHVGLGAARVRPPVALRRLVLGRSLGATLEPVASVTTRRTTYVVRDETGTGVAEVTDDFVTGVPAGASEAVSWREWEVELAAAEPSLLDRFAKALVLRGIHPSSSQRKIETTLGSRLPAQAAVASPKPKKSAERVLAARLAEQVEALLRHDVSIRRGDPEGVHQARVACRRLRSALVSFGALVDRSVTDPIREELRWLGSEIGPARDTVVAHERIGKALDSVVPGLVRGPVAERIEATYEEWTGEAMRSADLVLRGERYLSLIGALDSLLAETPWTKKAGRPAKHVVASVLRADAKRLRRRVADLPRASDPNERADAWHEARKAAKRLRYSAEAGKPALGQQARRVAKAAKRFTQVLGSHQDTVVSRAHILQLAEAAQSAGEPTFTYGLLLAREEQAAADLDARGWAAWKRSSPRLRIGG